MSLMRVLVIGGTRLSGPDIVRELLERDHLPAVLHRGEHELDLPGRVRHFHGDAGDIELLRYARREFQPTALIHMWAMLADLLEGIRLRGGGRRDGPLPGLAENLDGGLRRLDKRVGVDADGE